MRAQYALIAIYFNGLGVPKNYVQAHMWASLTAARGMDGAADGLDIIAEQMTPDQIAEAQRLAREWKEKHRK